MDSRGARLIVDTHGSQPQVVGVRRASGDAVRDYRRFMDSGPVTVPHEMIQRMQQGLPKVVRRDPRERYRATLERITKEALASYRATGRIVWPRSVEDELKVIAWKTGDPTLTQFGGIDQLQRQIEALTRSVVETGEMQQKANDRKKVTLDWSGH